MQRLSYYLLIVTLLCACQAGKNNLHNPVDKLITKGADIFSMTSSYAVIKHDFEGGRIMRARARALGMKASHHDYEKSQQLLNEKIEPARRRIFIHYLRKAKKLEQKHLWSEAMWAYDQAKTITIKPQTMEEKRAAMESKMRQLRLEKLLVQRRKEDAVLLNNTSAYASPKGVSPADRVYQRKRDQYNDMLDDRALLAYREAKRFMRKDVYEIAYVEIESYMRLQPGTSQGKRMLDEIRQKMPEYLHIPAQHHATTNVAKTAIVQRITKAKDVNSQQIQDAVQAGKLIQAKQLAHIYRRNGGTGGDKILGRIQQKLNTQAASLFAKGSKAFGQEQLDVAIQHWSDAVALTPEESEYVEALHRARQLQERLSLLQEKTPSGPIPEEE